MASDIEIKRAVETEVLPFVRVTGKKIVVELALLHRAMNELRARVAQVEKDLKPSTKPMTTKKGSAE